MTASFSEGAGNPQRKDLPDLAALESALTAAAASEGWAEGPVAVRRRDPLGQQSSFMGEVVSCDDGAGGTFRILCKYGDAYVRKDVNLHRAHGHRGGVAYEAMVYRRILAPARSTTPAFYGSHHDVDSDGQWLFIEYIDDATLLQDGLVDHGEALRGAAEWLGRFHAEWEPRPGGVPSDDLIAYERQYLLGWADRFAAYAEPLRDRYPWIAGLRSGLEQWARDLLAGPVTVIHGEFYPRNILVRGRAVFPVDWESAAIGPAEIDLAALTEGCDDSVTAACVDDYRRARWPDGGGDHPPLRVDPAKLYWDLRWLGDRPEWTVDERSMRRLDRVHHRAVQLGYLG